MRGLRQKRQRRDRSNSSIEKRTPTPVTDHIEQSTHIINDSNLWRMEAVIVSMLTLADKDDRLISPPFRVLPTPQEFPLYYEHIKKPIDIRKISENIRAGVYQTWASLKEDVQLMCKNARDFNEPGSTVHKDANTLLRHFKHRSTELAGARRFSPRVISRNAEIIDELLQSTESEINVFSEDSEEDEDSERSDDPRWRLYWAIRNYDVVDGVPLCENFIELPCKRSYPDYYEEIERPLSLYMINKLLKRGHYTSLDALVRDLLLMFENAMNYNIEDSEIYQAAVRFRQLTLKAAKALSSGDRVNGCSLPCNADSNETTTNKFQPAPKRGRPKKILCPTMKVSDSVNSIHNGFVSTEKKTPQKKQNNEYTHSIQQTVPSTSSTPAQFFSHNAATSSYIQQHSLNNTTNLSIMSSNSSQHLSSNVSLQGQFIQGSSTTSIVHSHILNSTTAAKQLTTNALQNRKHRTSALDVMPLDQASSTTSLRQHVLADTGRVVVSMAPKQIPIEPMFVSPSTSVHVRRVVHSEAYLRYLESMHNPGGSKQQRNISKWDKTLLASARNTVVVPEHKRLPYDWIRHSNISKHKEDEVVRALWKLREHLVEDTTGITRNGADVSEPPLISTKRVNVGKGRNNNTDKCS